MPKGKPPSSNNDNSTSKPPMSPYKSALKRHAAIQEIAKEYLCFALAEKPLTKTDMRNRDSRIGSVIDAAGGSLNTSDIRTLFYLLEEVACRMINEVAALAQTSDPDVANAAYPALPKSLIENTKILHRHVEKKSTTAKQSKAGKQRHKLKMSAKELCEAEYKKWDRSSMTRKIFCLTMHEKTGISDGTVSNWITVWDKKFNHSTG